MYMYMYIYIIDRSRSIDRSINIGLTRGRGYTETPPKEHGNDSLFYTAVEPDSLIALFWHGLTLLGGISTALPRRRWERAG